MSLQPYEHTDFRRCFPVKYALDALLTFLFWVELVALHSKGPREAATIILRRRLTDDDSSIESQFQAVQSIKSGAMMRVIGFLIGVLPSFIKLCACEGVFALQALGYLWVGPWVVLETLILASTPSITTAPSDHREVELQLHGSYTQKLRMPCSLAADMINIALCITPPFMFELDAWHNVSAVGLAESSPLDILGLMAASSLFFICCSWGFIVLIMMKAEKNGALWKHLKQVFTFGGALLLGGIWLPLGVLFSRAPKSFEVAFTIFLGAIVIAFLVISFIRQTFWKTDVCHLVNILGAMASILLHIFINYKDEDSYQPQWLAVLG